LNWFLLLSFLVSEFVGIKEKNYYIIFQKKVLTITANQAPLPPKGGTRFIAQCYSPFRGLGGYIRKKTKIKSIILTITLLSLAAYAFGPSGPPGDPSTAMYSIPDVCQRLESGAAGEKRVFRGPSSAPGTRSGCNLNELMDKAPAKLADGVNPNDVVKVI
jgi:hypothetical protein